MLCTVCIKNPDSMRILTLLQVYGSGTASRLASCLLSVGTLIGPARAL